jgi:hypothetical protein
METQSITVTVQDSMIHLRSGRPEDFGLEYHIQRDDFLCVELPDNPLKVDIFLMAFKEHPQQERIVKIVATPYLDMLLNGQSVPQWTHPITHAAEGGILILLEEE